MAHAIWKGHISFGLVEIPVSLVKAEQPHELDLHLVDRRDKAPIGYERINKNTGEPVAWEDIVRAQEEDGELVLLSDAELANANADAVRRIEILEFVDGADIHPAYFHRPYYLEPARKPVPKAYVLLRETLERTGKIGIATVVLRSRQHLAALTTRGQALVLILLRFGDELRAVEDLELPGDRKALDVRPKELEMAEQLVASMDATWDPDRYRDTYFEDVMNMIAAKRAAGQTEPLEVEEAAERESTSLVDLMPLLERSMKPRAGNGHAKPAASEARGRKRKAAAHKPAARKRRPPTGTAVTRSRSRAARTRKSA